MKVPRSLKKTAKTASWKMVVSIFKTFNHLTPYFGYPVIGPKLKRMADLEPEAKTQGYTLNLNVDVADKAEGVNKDYKGRAVIKEKYEWLKIMTYDIGFGRQESISYVDKDKSEKSNLSNIKCVDVFIDGLARVYADEKWGFIDKSNAVVIRILLFI